MVCEPDDTAFTSTHDDPGTPPRSCLFNKLQDSVMLGESPLYAAWMILSFFS